MDNMLGEQFEKGLANMKKLAESPQALQYAGTPSGPYHFTIDEREIRGCDYPHQDGQGEQQHGNRVDTRLHLPIRCYL